MHGASATSTPLDELIARFIAPRLKTEGFRRRSRSFFKPVGDLFHCVWIQSSRWNRTYETSFAANLRVVWPRWHEVFTGDPISENPSLAASVAEIRVGRLMSGSDQWWLLDNETDAASLGAEVVRNIIEASSSFFPSFSSSDDVLRRLEAHASLPGLITGPLLRATLLASARRNDEAERILEQAALENPKWDAVARVAAILDLPRAT